MSTTPFLLTGQTDSGKSTIAGHLLLKTGYFSNVSDDDKKAYRTHLENIDSSTSKSKFSILLDIGDGEVLNNKTKTREFSIHEFTFEKFHYRLIDTPGHQLYIRSLLEAMFLENPKVVCLVVSSIENEFSEACERGTVKEDLLLSRSVGCRHLLVLWNKTDLCKPSESMRKTLITFCNGLRFQTIDSLEVSGYTGEGVLNILEYVKKYSEEQTNTETYPERTATELKAKAVFFMNPTDEPLLISRGFQFVLHHVTGEYDAEIESLSRLGKNIVINRSSEPVDISISVSEKISHSVGSKIVFRHQKKTIGFGVTN